MTWDEGASERYRPRPRRHSRTPGGGQPPPEASAPRDAPAARGRAADVDPKAARRDAVDILARKAWSLLELTRRLERRGAPADRPGLSSPARGTGIPRRRELCRLVAQARGQGRRVGNVRLARASPRGSRASWPRPRRRGVAETSELSGPRWGPAQARGALTRARRASPGPAGRLSAAPRLTAIGGGPGRQGAPRRRRGRGGAVTDSADDDGGGLSIMRS